MRPHAKNATCARAARTARHCHFNYHPSPSTRTTAVLPAPTGASEKVGPRPAARPLLAATFIVNNAPNPTNEIDQHEFARSGEKLPTAAERPRRPAAAPEQLLGEAPRLSAPQS